MKARDIFGLDGLADLGSRHGIDMRPTLLRVLTDLYVHRLSHTAAEERHYTELALRLLEAVDLATRIGVAKRFRHYLSPPLRVLQWLTRDVPEVAAELSLHPLLQPRASRAATALPADPPQALAHNVPDDLQLHDTEQAIDLATADELNERFFEANAEERRLILRNLNVVAPLDGQRVRVTRDSSIEKRLEAAALSRNRDDFSEQLARVLDISREQARRIAHDDLGEPVVVAGKALGLRREVLYRILMFLNPAVGHSVERVHALAALYDEMTLPAATGVLAIWQALQPHERAKAKHRPLTWDDETRRRPRPTASTQRAPVAPRANERRRSAS
jgi:hypothetical protein